MFNTTQTMRMGVAIIAGAVLFVSTNARVARAEDGKAVYNKNCLACHGASGKGDGPAAKALKPPPGDFATVAKALSDADIAKVITEGKATSGKAHQPFAKKLSGDQIKAVAQHVKQLSAK